MNYRLLIFTGLCLTVCSAYQAKAEPPSTENAPQNNSVESFFEISPSSKANTAFTKSKNDKDATIKQKKTDGLIFKVLDNLGVPMPMKLVDGADPTLAGSVKDKNKEKNKEQATLAKPESANLERIQLQDQSTASDPSKTILNKIPKSELEGTMFDPSATPDDKKPAQ